MIRIGAGIGDVTFIEGFHEEAVTSAGRFEDDDCRRLYGSESSSALFALY